MAETERFLVELVCEERKTTEVKILTLESQPRIFLDVKNAIEEEFSIPVCVQTLLHQSNPVADSDTLESCYVRSGDTFQVTYPIEGECEKALEVETWLRQLADTFRSHITVKETSPEGTLFQLDKTGYPLCADLMSGYYYTSLARELSLNLVFPWTNRTKYVNKLHLDSHGVVEVAMFVYECVQCARIANTPLVRGNFLETVCALFVANFAQTFPLRRRIVEHGGLEYSVRTFLRYDADVLGDACDTIEVSLYAVCK